jgi:hypothetical protein
LSSTLNFVFFDNFNHSCSLHIVQLRNKMKPEFLADSMSVYVEKEISACISFESIIDNFKSLEKRNDRLYKLCSLNFK